MCYSIIILALPLNYSYIEVVKFNPIIYKHNKQLFINIILIYINAKINVRILSKIKHMKIIKIIKFKSRINFQK